MAESDHITTGRSPAFQFYPDDFVAGTVTLLTEEVGAYMLLMCYCWNKGSIPADIPSLARITRLTPARMQRAWLALRPKFQQLESGDLFQPRIERERRKQAEFRAEQKRKGLASAAARAARPTKPQPNVNRGSTPVATEHAAMQPQDAPHQRHGTWDVLHNPRRVELAESLQCRRQTVRMFVSLCSLAAPAGRHLRKGLTWRRRMDRVEAV